MGKLDKFTLNLLTNDEVISINQDALGKEARQAVKKETYQVWVKQLEHGKALGIFNTSDKYQTISLGANDDLLKGYAKALDVWTQTTITGAAHKLTFKIPPHGVKLIKIYN